WLKIKKRPIKRWAKQQERVRTLTVHNRYATWAYCVHQSKLRIFNLHTFHMPARFISIDSEHYQ
ncbi:MAG TPA: hypothetical protein DCW49_10065, partial [Alteromonas australica]|nr:hypothetical protein [Alteromonas australica]